MNNNTAVRKQFSSFFSAAVQTDLRREHSLTLLKASDNQNQRLMFNSTTQTERNGFKIFMFDGFCSTASLCKYNLSQAKNRSLKAKATG
jgi:hypothetical protein